MEYNDAGHRPHGIHTKDIPKFDYDHGPDGIKVTLREWGPNSGRSFAQLWCRLQANWGDEPAVVEKDEDLTPGQWEYIKAAFAGNGLQNPLEAFTFSFEIDGVSRACTHQLVRTRIGAAMMQHGGRDNDWRHRNFTVPETIRRACEHLDYRLRGAGVSDDGLRHCITDPEPLIKLRKQMSRGSVWEAYKDCVEWAKLMYAALIDSGVPWQDARRILPIGMQTFIFIDYNWVALRGVTANRLEHVMDWEINCVAQLMKREICHACPPWMGAALMSHSDRAGAAKFDKMDSWPPDGKHPSPHMDDERTHRREQMPYWVLHPSCYTFADTPITWVPTNGTWPDDAAFSAALALTEEKRDAGEDAEA